MVVYPQKFGCFSLPDGATMAKRYALKTAPTKDGGTKYKFPALYYGYTRSYGVAGINAGDWHLPDVFEGTQLMKDECLDALSPTITKMNTTAIVNSTDRWWAARYGVYGAWFFYGSGGSLYSGYVYYALRCQAVALLEID
jgi:hypothetical protein